MSTGEPQQPAQQQESAPTVVWRPPSAGSRLTSSLATSLASLGLLLGVGFVAFVVIGGIALLALLLTGHGFDGLQFGNAATPDAEVPAGLPTRETWPDWVVPAVVVPCLLIAIVASVVGAARFGHGTVGDGVTGIEARTADGATPSRTRVLARVAIPVLVVLVLVARGSGVLAVLAAALLLWLPALAPSRRSLADLLTGIHPQVPVEPKLGRRWDAGAAEGPR